jgi:hypothetical protein
VSLNLHAAVRGPIQTVNPDLTAVYYSSQPPTTAADGQRTPVYIQTPAQVQVQALSGKDLRHESFMNIQGVKRSVYMFGNTQGVSRPDVKGGDLLAFPQVRGGANQLWLVVIVLESWSPDPASWCKLGVVLQSDAPP